MRIKKKWTRNRNKRRKVFFLKKNETTMIIFQKGMKTRSRKTRKRHTLQRRRFWQDDVHKKYVNNKKGEQTRQKTEKHRKGKKETRDKQKEWQVFYKGVQKLNGRRGSGKKEGFREKDKTKKEIKRRRVKTRKVLRKEGRNKSVERDRWNRTKGGRNKNYRRGKKNALKKKKRRKTLS